MSADARMVCSLVLQTEFLVIQGIMRGKTFVAEESPVE